MIKPIDETNAIEAKELSGSVLVCGGGIAGMQAALDLSGGGFYVYLLEETPAVGGTMARLDKTFPTGDCATCTISPKMVALLRDLNIEVITMADLLTLDGTPGNIKARIRQRPRYVNIDKCTVCSDCSDVCPISIPNKYNGGLTKRKAIDREYAQSAPNAFVIEKKQRGACSSACPIDTSVQAYIALIADGRTEEAAKVIWRENPLPSICGRVCFHPCEANCNRGNMDESLNIRDLKRYAVESCGTPVYEKENIQPTGKKVAIVGGGPAGLSAAHSLALLGHQVKIIDSLPMMGGVLAVGIPDYRLPPEILKRDIDLIADLGVEFQNNTAVGRDVPAKKLLEENDAVFLASGAHKSRILDIPGEDCDGVLHGIDFLREFSLTKELKLKGNKAVIVGGGNTAIDSARTAIRLGADEVSILYRRTRGEMPAEDIEVEAALEEGVRIEFLTTPVKVNEKDGKIASIECIRMALGEPDDSGRRSPSQIAGSEFNMAADLLIPAVSQSPFDDITGALGVEVTRWGTVEVDEVSLSASKAGIFAGGDLVLGPSSVIEAIAHGKRAAGAIDNFLNNKDLDEGLKKPPARARTFTVKELAEKRRAYQLSPRINPSEEDPGKRINSFDEVEKIFTADEAKAEASRCLSCGICCECLLCEDACKAGAVEHDQKVEERELEVGAVILTPGFSAFDSNKKLELGAAYYDNVITNIQYERMLSASGPTEGHIHRPSDASTPKKIAFIQCVGSRDAGCGNGYCSSVCCMAATKEAIQTKQHEPDTDVTIFYMDLRAYGKDFDRYYNRAKEMGVHYIQCRPSSVEKIHENGNLKVSYIDSDDNCKNEEFGMIVLSLGLEPSSSLKEQAERLGIMLNDWGFAKTSDLAPLDTNIPGVFVSGVFQEPKDIPDTVMQASAAAARAMSMLGSARGTNVITKSYPPERDITDEPPRIGVFVCHCGSNIASVVDIEKVLEQTRLLPNVAYAENNVYTCADDSQVHMKEMIKEYHLNRIIVASCTPRTHEAIFRDTIREAGLNQYLLEMANIRDQCSWVHSDNPELATRKACDLIRMTVGRAAGLISLKDSTVPVKNGALVIGGGIAGMTVSLALAEQGFPVYLVEKTAELGGTSREVQVTLDGSDVQAFIDITIEKTEKHPRIKVFKNAKVAKVDGHVGDFESTIETSDGETKFEHGVVVLATGAIEKTPESFGYENNKNVITQLELSGKIARNELDLPEKPSIVMIQCVEQRDEAHPYCSRVCCTTAVKNALLLRERYPKARIIVLYRDMRTYGFREAAYTEARSKDIIFERYDTEHPPVLSDDSKLTIQYYDAILEHDVNISSDLLVLSTPIIARDDREELSELLRVPINADGFFVEAHVKLRPVDFASEGLFLCGTVHAPKFISETISQANAVAGRAAGILSLKEMPVAAQIAWVDPDKCIACMTCLKVCPYQAPGIGKDSKAEIQGTVCMGCGSCTATCPAKAITLHHYVDSQVLGAIDSLLGANTPKGPEEPLFLESVGITQTRWHHKENHHHG